MNKPAAIEGYYTDAKFMRGIKTLRLSIDVPIEYSNEFLRMFGAPDGVSPVRVAIARMQDNGPDGGIGGLAVPQPHAEPAKDQDRPRTYTRSQVAAMKCQDASFKAWLRGRAWPGMVITDDDFDADAALKDMLGITSKRELDTNPSRAKAWDALLTDFDMRDIAR